MRFSLTTDAPNNYFNENVISRYGGSVKVIIDGNNYEGDLSKNLYEGRLNLQLPVPKSQIGNVHKLEFLITDHEHSDGYNTDSNYLYIKIGEIKESTSTSKSKRKTSGNNPGKDTGQNTSGLPEMEPVNEDGWNESNNFDSAGVLHIVTGGDGTTGYANMDNKYLLHAKLQNKKDAEIYDQFYINFLQFLTCAAILDNKENSEYNEYDDWHKFAENIGMLIIPILDLAHNFFEINE